MKRKPFSVLFFINKKKLLKNGEAPIYLRISVDGIRVEANLKYGLAYHRNRQARNRQPTSGGNGKNISQTFRGDQIRSAKSRYNTV